MLDDGRSPQSGDPPPPRHGESNPEPPASIIAGGAQLTGQYKADRSARGHPALPTPLQGFSTDELLDRLVERVPEPPGADMTSFGLERPEALKSAPQSWCEGSKDTCTQKTGAETQCENVSAVKPWRSFSSQLKIKVQYLHC